MPQLSPVFWILSIFMVLYFLIYMIKVYVGLMIMNIKFIYKECNKEDLWFW